jgi:hypothetical protein
MEEERQRFTVLNRRHLTNAYDASQYSRKYSRKLLNFNTCCFSKNMKIYKNNGEIETGEHFGNQAFFISNGS